MFRFKITLPQLTQYPVSFKKTSMYSHCNSANDSIKLQQLNGSKSIFLHQVALTIRQSDLCGLRIKLPPTHLSTTNVEASHCPFLLLNVKQESCGYQFL